MPAPSSARSRAHARLARLVDLRAGEAGALAAAFLMFFCLLGGYTLLRPLRDAMGLAGGGGDLPWLFSATFVAMLALVPVFGALSGRLPPRRFVPLVYRFFSLNLLGFAALAWLDLRTPWVARTFFVWVSVYNLFVVSVFWSVLADSFTPEQGRRLFGVVAAGGTAGTLAGPALAAALAPAIGAAGLTLLAALLLEAAVFAYARLVATRGGGENPARRAVGGGVWGGVRAIAASPYLLAIAAYMLLHTAAATLIYFEQARIVGAAWPDIAMRTRFFALVDVAVSVLTLALQALLSGRLIRRIGVGGALALLPLAAIGAFAALAFDPRPLVLGAAQVARRSIDYALSRPAREVLFTVVDREAKYKAKSAIDTLVYRGGDAASGWLAALLAGVGGGAVAAGVALPALGWAALSLWLGRRQAALEPGRRR